MYTKYFLHRTTQQFLGTSCGPARNTTELSSTTRLAVTLVVLPPGLAGILSPLSFSISPHLLGSRHLTSPLLLFSLSLSVLRQLPGWTGTTYRQTRDLVLLATDSLWMVSSVLYVFATSVDLLAFLFCLTHALCFGFGLLDGQALPLAWPRKVAYLEDFPPLAQQQRSRHRHRHRHPAL